jgi:hypothetical protein
MQWMTRSGLFWNLEGVENRGVFLRRTWQKNRRI